MSTPQLTPSILNFLTALNENNNREWFNTNKNEFDRQKAEVKTFFNSVYSQLNTHDKVDSFKQFRIYRDVRFSKDKTPYKTHFAASFHRVKPELRGGYYIRIKPNNQSFIATGIWSPEKEDLLRLRKEFEIDGQELVQLLNTKTFTDIWGDLEGEQVKTAPKGFDKAHVNINLIRKKQLIFSKSLTDNEVLSPDLFNTIDNSFKVIRPFFNYLSEVLTTNLNGEPLV